MSLNGAAVDGGIGPLSGPLEGQSQMALAATEATPPEPRYHAALSPEVEKLLAEQDAFDPIQPAYGTTVGLRTPVGAGKTHDMIAAASGVLATDPDARVGFAVPNHELAEEAEKRLRDAMPGVSVGRWRGTAQPDPAAPGETMCRRPADVKAVGEAGGEMADLCGSKRRGFCPFHPEAGGSCGYIAQGKAQNSVWVVTHAMLSRRAPGPLDRATSTDKHRPAVDLLIIDESFYPAMVGSDGYEVEMSDISATIFASVPDRISDLKPAGWATKVFAHTRAAMRGLLSRATTGARIDKTDLAQMGLNETRCLEAAGYALRCKVDLSASLRGSPPGAAAAGLGATGADNRAVLRVAKLFQVAADVHAGKLGPGALTVVDDKKTKVRRVVVRWEHDIHKHWAEAHYGTFHSDATMQEEIVRRFLPGIVVTAVAPVAAPHMRVFQVWDKTFGYSAVIDTSNKGPDGAHAAQTNAKRVRRIIDELSVRCAGQGVGGQDVLVILPLALEAQFRAKNAPPLPANAALLHFGKLRGIDAFKGVRALVVVSRPLPPPQAMEDLADILFGVEVERLPLGEFYPKRDALRIMQDGTARAAQAYYHPDPRVEAVRWAACEAEMIQAIGRVRGIHRTAANPVDVFVLSNVPLADVAVTAVYTLAKFWNYLAAESLLTDLLRGGVLPSSWPGIGAVLAGRGRFSPKTVDPGHAARCWFARNPGEKAELAAARRRLVSASIAQTSYRNPLLTLGGLSGTRAGGPWTRYTYRQTGNRQTSTVLVAPFHTDPRAAAEAALGPLSHFVCAPQRVGSPPAVITTAPAQTPVIAPLPLIVGPTPAAVHTPEPLPEPGAPNSTPDLAAGRSPPAVQPAGSAQARPSLAPAEMPEVVMPLGGAPLGSPPQTSLDSVLEARIANVPLGLPPVLDALVRRGLLSQAERRQHMVQLRMGRGSHNERERQALARLVLRLGAAAMAAAARAAAMAKLGLTAHPTTP